MGAKDRRRGILDRLRQADAPVSASTLAAELGVSRQIIVGDVALLRASGAEITATPRGYVILTPPAGLVRTVACRHSGADMELELNAIVDNGCTVLDVIVEHPIYGQLTGSLQLKSRYDVERYLRRCNESKAHPLSALTEGLHLHTLVCPDEAAWLRVLEQLRMLGILFSSEEAAREETMPDNLLEM